MPSFLSGLHLDLWVSGHAPSWLWCKLLEHYYWWDVQTPQHEEVANHSLSPPDKWVEWKVPSNYHTVDWEAQKRWKQTDWPGHLAEIVHAYNATQSAVMGYNPHYLMFRYRPRLPVKLYFLTLRSTEGPIGDTSTKCVVM